MKLSNPVEGGVLDFDPFNTRTVTDPSHDLGALVELNDYRAFRHIKVGASNTSAGKANIAPAPIANHHNMSVLAAALNTNLLTVTPGATAGAAGIYDEGFAVINAGPGVGQTLKVSHNPAITSSTAFIISLQDALSVALTTSSKVSLVHSQFNGAVEAAVQTRRVNGVPLVGLTAAAFGWAQTKGLASVLAQGTIAVGSDIVPSSSVAGAVAAVSGTYATDLITARIGQALVMAGVDTEYRPMVLSID